jgi:hypothetical protein
MAVAIFNLLIREFCSIKPASMNGERPQTYQTCSCTNYFRPPKIRHQIPWIVNSDNHAKHTQAVSHHRAVTSRALLCRGSCWRDVMSTLQRCYCAIWRVLKTRLVRKTGCAQTMGTWDFSIAVRFCSWQLRTLRFHCTKHNKIHSWSVWKVKNSNHKFAIHIASHSTCFCFENISYNWV